jgi:hypothetical protein
MEPGYEITPTGLEAISKVSILVSIWSYLMVLFFAINDNQ